MLGEGIYDKFGFDIAFVGYELGEVVYDLVCCPVALFPEVSGEQELFSVLPEGVNVCDFYVFEEAFLDFWAGIGEVLHVHHEGIPL